MAPSRSIFWLAALLTIVSALGCATAAGGRVRSIGSAELRSRARLTEAARSGDDPLAASLRLLRIHAREGQIGAARDEAKRALGQARRAWHLAEIEDASPHERREAQRRAQAVAREVIDVAQRLTLHELVLEAALSSPRPRAHRAAVVDAARLATWIPAHLPAADLLALVGDDARARAQLHMALAWRGDAESDDTELLAAGPHARAARVAALRRRVHRRVDAGALAPWVQAVVRDDPTELDAALLELVLADIAADRAPGDSRLFADVASSWVGSQEGRLARLRLRAAAHPEAEGIALARAHWLAEAGLVGDARSVLDDASTSTPRAAAIAAQISAMLSLQSGDAGAFERWRGSLAEGPCAVDAWAAGHDREDLSDAVRTVARHARARRALKADDPSIDELQGVWLDGHATRRERARAGRMLAEHDRETWEITRICRARELDVDECWALSDVLIGEDEGAALPATLLELKDWPHVQASWLGNAAWLEGEGVRMLAPVVARLAGTNVAASAEFQRLALRVAVARGDGPAARDVLDRGAAFLEPGPRAWGELAILDLADGAQPDELLSTWVWEPNPTPSRPPAWARDPEEIAAQADDDTRVGRWAHATELVAEGHPAAAMKLLQPLLVALPVARHPEAWVMAAHAAAVAGRGKVSDAWRADVVHAHPHAPRVRWLEGWVAERLGRPADARARHADALRRDPTLTVAFDAYLDLVLGDAPLPELRRLLLSSAGATAPGLGTGSALASALEADPGVPRERLLALREAERSADGAVAWRARAQLHDIPDLARRASSWARSRLVEDIEPSAAVKLAGELAAFLGRAEPDALRDERLWLLLLAGRVDDAERLADSTDRESGQRRVEDGTEIRHLLAARREGAIDDATAFDLYRWWRRVDGPWNDRVDALLREAKHGDLLSVACQELSARDDVTPAKDVCARAWADAPRSASLAVSASYVALELGDVALGDLVFDGSVTAPAFGDPAHDRDESTRAWQWHQNRAVWLESKKRPVDAAASWWQAYALGCTYRELTDAAYEQVAERGELVRSLQRSDEGEAALAAIRAFTALREPDTKVAEVYAKAALRAYAPPKDDEPQSALAWAHQVIDLAALIRADASAKRAPAGALASAVRHVDDGSPAEEIAKTHARYPGSSTLAFALAHAYARDAKYAAAEPLLGPLVERHPEVPWVAAVAARVHEQLGSVEKARAIFQRAARARPDDWMLAHATVTEAVSGPRARVPSWAREVDEFAARLGSVDDAAIAALAPRRRAESRASAELWFPLSAETIPERQLGARLAGGGRQFVLTSPRASRCIAERCAAPLKQELSASGSTLLWSRQVKTGAGTATELLFSSDDEMLSALVVPSGGRVFTVAVAAPHERFAEVLPVIELARRSFRPLDGVLPSYRAETLRVSSGWRVSSDARLRARAEQARDDGRGCPIESSLGALKSDAARAELLLDVWLSTPQVDGREALMRCADPGSPTARRIATIALLDESTRVHDYGRRAVKSHATRVVADAEAIFATVREHAISAPTYLAGRNLPPRALFEVLANLPREQARRVLDELLGGDERDRAVAWAALRLRPDIVPRATVRAELATLPPVYARIAVSLLDEDALPEDLAALRARLDAVASLEDRAGRSLAVRLAGAVARHLEPGDAPRLRAASAALPDGDDATEASRARDAIDAIAEDHRRGLELLADPTLEPGPDDARAVAWRDAEARARTPGRTRDAAELRTAALADVLPGPDWTFVRLSTPGLFATALGRIASQVTTGADPAMDEHLRSLLRDRLRDAGLAQLAEGGGLDASRPVECASPADDPSFVCVATVADRDALLDRLGERDYGEDTGVSLPLALAPTVGLVPVVLSSLPAWLHAAVSMRPDEDDAPAEIIATERARSIVRIARHRMERYAIARVSADGVSIDSEHYLFVGDRVWIFGTPGMAMRVLHAHDETPLSKTEEFSRLTARWRRGAALQAVVAGRALGLGEGGASAEVALDDQGIAFRYTGALSDPLEDVSAVASLLPDGSVTRFAVGMRGPSILGAHVEDPEDPQSRLVPPYELWPHLRGVALGWYPEDGDRLWSRWLAAAPWDDEVARALRERGVRLRRDGEHATKGGVHFARAHDHLLISSRRDLLDAAIARGARVETSGELRRVGEFGFDAKTAAARIRDLSSPDTTTQGLFTVTGAFLGAFGDLDLKATWDPAEKLAVFEGRVPIRVEASDDDTDVVDGWLAATEAPNAGRLPRTLDPADVEQPLVFELEVPDAEAFVRDAVSKSARLKATVIGPNRVKLAVSPRDDRPAGEPLSARARKDALADASGLSVRHPRIVEVARRLAPDGTAADAGAAAIVKWVHQRVRYELTPRSLTGLEILDSGRGDCTEYARLTVSLLRASGIPAEVRGGLLASGDEMVAHAWAAYHDGDRWREVDPTAGEAEVTAGHLELSVMNTLALISLGKMRVVSVTTAP